MCRDRADVLKWDPVQDDNLAVASTIHPHVNMSGSR